MDVATLLGIIFGSGLVLGAILMGGQAILFINVPGLLIVDGVIAIIKGQAPSVLKECLQTYLPPKVRMAV